MYDVGRTMVHDRPLDLSSGFGRRLGAEQRHRMIGARAEYGHQHEVLDAGVLRGTNQRRVPVAIDGVRADGIRPAESLHRRDHRGRPADGAHDLAAVAHVAAHDLDVPVALEMLRARRVSREHAYLLPARREPLEQLSQPRVPVPPATRIMCSKLRHRPVADASTASTRAAGSPATRRRSRSTHRAAESPAPTPTAAFTYSAIVCWNAGANTTSPDHSSVKCA